MKTITICNHKGGVGKTTTAVTLAHGLILKGKTVLLVDLDPQAQVTSLLGTERDPGVYDLLVSSRNKTETLISKWERGDIDLIQGNRDTATAQATLRERPIDHIKSRLGEVKRRYDYCLLDTAPSVGEIQVQAIYAADYLLIPSAVDFLSSEGVYKLLDTVALIREKHSWDGELLAVVPTFYDQVSKESQITLDELRERFNGAVVNPIHRATVLREAAAEGRTIFEIDPKSRAAEEYQVLIDHVVRLAK